MNLSKKIFDLMLDPPAVFNTDGSEYKDTGLNYQKIRSALFHACTENSIVGIAVEKGPEYMLCMFACMELGIPYVPLKNDYPQARIEEITEDASLTFLIDSSTFTKLLGEEVKAFDRKEVSQQHPLYIMFTSGSSGRPKGVVVSRRAFCHFEGWLCEYLSGVTEKDRCLQVTEFTFDISLVDLIVYLNKKTPLYFSEFKGNIFRLAYELETYSISFLSTVPNNINMLLEDSIASRVDLSKINCMLLAGSRFSYGLYLKCKKYFSKKHISNCYGPTEFTVYSHAKKLSFEEDSDCDEQNISIGSPNDGLQAIIVKDEEVRDINERGELLLAGPQIMNEYINNSERTDEAIFLLDGVRYYKTGDVAYKKENGNYHVVGRVDDTIKYRGYRINLLDVESYVSRLESIQDAAIFAIPDEFKENKTICYLIKKREYPDMTEVEVRDSLKKVILDYQIPEEIFFIEKYPTNISGKVDKKALKKIYWESQNE